MARCSIWNTIIQKFSSKLAFWKARLLSVGGRLSLIKLVLGHLLIYYMSIYPMPSSIQKKLESMRSKFFLGGDIESGSSGIDSLHSSNIIKTTFEGVGGTLMWSIWSYRNRLIFSDPPPKKAVLWDAIVYLGRLVKKSY
nr:RNA-directed DNA polymerase, eukaryota, reverse transcriptase zinc-binding domain protein [Tanacetum cinerariifolium]